MYRRQFQSRALPDFRQRADGHVVRASVLAAVAVLMGGCGEKDEGANDALCDGSAGARLVYLSDGGNVPTTYSFTHAYGHSFFVVDGTCQYWAGEAYLKGIRTGTLTRDRANSIARALHYAQFARLKSYTGRACPDAGTSTISDGINHVRCTCDCSDQTPVEYQQAFMRLQGIFRELFDGAEPAGLPIRVIATDQASDSLPALAWPLPWSPREVLFDGPGAPSASAGRLITDTSELSALRTLRQAAVDRNAYWFGVEVSASGSVFAVHPRDEAPAEVAAAVAAAR